MSTVLAGIDGCKAGWIAVVGEEGAAPEVRLFAGFAEMLAELPGDAVVVVDMPIGLPDRVGRGGRGPEALVRSHLGQRQSSVFSIPSRAAVHAEQGPFRSVDEWYAAHRRASAVARATSDPPRAVSIQAFGIFSKIREIDRLLIERPELRLRVFESHPELAFWSLAKQSPMTKPKKIRGRINPEGMKERRDLLVSEGMPAALFEPPVPRGAGEDDLLDAAAMQLVAARIARGEAMSFPSPPLVDGHGIPVAIWC